jgi:hypothetical protein
MLQPHRTSSEADGDLAPSRSIVSERKLFRCAEGLLRPRLCDGGVRCAHPTLLAPHIDPHDIDIA